MKVLLATCLDWYLPHTARAFNERDSLAGLWISNKNSTGVPSGLYRRAWIYHLALKPWFHLAPQIWAERAVYAHFPLWRAWFGAQQPPPACNVVQAIMGFATEPFDLADRLGALKVVDCPNSHPTTLAGYWQRECDLWCRGERVPIPRWMLARMNREVARADLVLCPSNFVRDSMLANGIAESKCFVNPFGVDTAIFKPRKTVPATPRFVCVGTICLRKGHQYLLRAFELVRQQLPQAELICVGQYKTDFRQERPRWEGTFRHIPRLSHQELAELYQSCTAFVLPSLEEGFARVIPEAMGAGLPIIASHESGATTLVRDGVEGLIVRGQETKQIAAAMWALATDPQRNQAMGAAAHRHGALGNNWQDYGDRLLAEYQRHDRT